VGNATAPRSLPHRYDKTQGLVFLMTRRVLAGERTTAGVVRQTSHVPPFSRRKEKTWGSKTVTTGCETGIGKCQQKIIRGSCASSPLVGEFVLAAIPGKGVSADRYRPLERIQENRNFDHNPAVRRNVNTHRLRSLAADCSPLRISRNGFFPARQREFAERPHLVKPVSFAFQHVQPHAYPLYKQDLIALLEIVRIDTVYVGHWRRVGNPGGDPDCPYFTCGKAVFLAQISSSRACSAWKRSGVPVWAISVLVQVSRRIPKV
jgi:hypothetical protein